MCDIDKLSPLRTLRSKVEGAVRYCTKRKMTKTDTAGLRFALHG